MRKIVLIIVIALAAALPAAFVPEIASATTFTPTCGVASLRSALNSAAATAGPHTINLPAGCVYRFSDYDSPSNTDNALPVVTRDVTINGNGAAFERQAGAPPMRFLEVRGLDTLTVRDLAFRHGSNPPPDGYIHSPGYAGDTNGGALRCNNAGLVVEDVTFEDNEAMNGGAVFVENCNVQLTRTVFSYNRASDGDGGGMAQITDPSWSTFSELWTDDSEFLDNEAAGDGGALFADLTYLHVDGSAFRRNHADDDGGGIWAATQSEPWQVTIEWSTISRNSAGDLGGGLFTGSNNETEISWSSIWGNDARLGGGIAAGRDTDIMFSTISGNDASDEGGAIAQYAYGTLTVDRVTFGDNVAGSGNAHVLRAWGELDAYNTLFAYTGAMPTGDLCDVVPGGWIITLDVASLSEGPCLSVNSIPAGSAQLQPLAQNGGPTRTNAIGAGSTARDAGDQPTCDSLGWSRDQRGAPYWGTYGGACDVGAYEWQWTAVPYAAHWNGPVAP